MTRRNPLLDRRALFTSAVAATLLAASGVATAGVPRRGGVLRMALSGAARSDSWVSGDGLFMQVARQGLVFDTLTEVAADGTLKAELATDWQASQDGRIWLFALREGVTFHDGMPFSALDVVHSLQPLIQGTVLAKGASQVQIILDAPDAGLPLTLAHPDFVIRPAHAPEAGIGTGLYRMTHFVAGQQLRSTRVADHYKGDTVGWFDAVDLSSIPSEPVRAEALGAYLVDATDLTDAGNVAGLPDVVVLPDSLHVTQAVSRDLAQPALIGSDRPMDNLRAAERWWFG